MENISKSDIKSISEKLIRFEDYSLKKNRYNDHYINYKGIKDLRYLFDEDENEDYYEPKLINTAFKNNYFQYQSGSDRKNMLPPNEYFKMTEPHLIKMINKHKNDDSWKIQLTIKINFTSVQDFNDKRSLYVKTKNAVIMEASDINEIINEIFDSLIKKYQELLEYSTKSSGLISEGVESMTYDINKTTINRGGSYT